MSKGKVCLIIFGIIAIILGVGTAIGAWFIEDAKEETIKVTMYSYATNNVDEIEDYMKSVKGVKTVKYHDSNEVLEEKQKQGYYKNVTSASSIGLYPYFEVTVKKQSTNEVIKKFRESKYKSYFYSVYKQYNR